jgi:hypothetical protein
LLNVFRQIAAVWGTNKKNQAVAFPKAFLYKKLYFLTIVKCAQLGICVEKYTECPGGNVPDFGRMFLKLKYNDITQNTYIRS